MTTAYLSRAMQVILQPLQGHYSSGALRVVSTADTSLSPGRLLTPIVGGGDRDDAVLKVEKNPATPDGSWPITTAGADVLVTSLQGGLHTNLPAGTRCRFDEPPAGIAELPTVSSAGLSGGARLDAFGALRQVRVFKDLGSQPDAKAFFGASVGEYPAVVLTWAATTPGDGSVSPSIGEDGTRLGNGKRLYAHEWTAFIISSRRDSSDLRKREGDQIRDDILELLTDRQAYRGVALSRPNGIKVIDARLAATSPTAYVDVIRFVTWFILQRRDERTFNDWLTSRMDAPTLPTGGDVPALNDARFPMR